MSEFKNLTLDVADQIAVLTISRPAALNALNSETLDELNVALTEIEARDDVKVLILTGGPDKKGNEFKSFVAGADIATVPPAVIKQMIKHPLTDQGIAKFQADYKAVFGE